MSEAALDFLFFAGWLLSFSVLVGGAFGCFVAFLESVNGED